MLDVESEPDVEPETIGVSSIFIDVDVDVDVDVDADATIAERVGDDSESETPVYVSVA